MGFIGTDNYSSMDMDDNIPAAEKGGNVYFFLSAGYESA